MAGAAGAAFGIGSSAIGFGGGYIISAFDYKALFILGAAFSLGAALLFGLCFYRVGTRSPAWLASKIKKDVRE